LIYIQIVLLIIKYAILTFSKNLKYFNLTESLIPPADISKKGLFWTEKFTLRALKSKNP